MPLQLGEVYDINGEKWTVTGCKLKNNEYSKIKILYMFLMTMFWIEYDLQ